MKNIDRQTAAVSNNNSTGIYTEKQCTIDFSLYPDEKEINIVIQQELPMDGLFGLFDPAGEGSFSIKTLGETYYRIFFKNCGKTDVTNTDASYASKQIERFTFYIGNYTINFKQTPSYGYYIYTIVHAIPVIPIENGTAETLTADYAYLTVDLNTEVLSQADFLALLGASSITITLSGNGGVLAEYTYNASQIQDFWAAGEPMVQWNLPEDQKSGQLSFLATINSKSVEAVECRVFPANQQIHLEDMYSRLRHKPLVLNLTNNTGEVITSAEHKNSGLNQNTIAYGKNLPPRNYDVNIALTENFGPAALSRLFLKLYTQLEGIYSYDDFLAKAAAVSLTLEDTANGKTFVTSFDAAKLLTESLSLSRSISLDSGIQNLRAYYNFTNFEKTADPDADGLLRSIWRYVHGDFGRVMAVMLDQELSKIDTYAADFADLKSTFGRHYYFLLSFSAEAFNIIRSCLASDPVSAEQLAILLGNLDAMASKNPAYWIDKSLLADEESFLGKVKSALEKLIEFGTEKALSFKELLSPEQAGTAFKELTDLFTGHFSALSVTDEAAADILEAMTGFSDYLPVILKEIPAMTQTEALDLFSARIRQYVKYEGIASEESLLGAFDLYFTPTVKEPENYRTDFNFRFLEVQPQAVIADKRFYHSYNALFEEVLLYNAQSKSWSLNLMELDKSEITEFCINNTLIFSSETEIDTTEKIAVTISFLDENEKLLSTAEVAAAVTLYKENEVQISEGLLLNASTASALLKTYRLQFTIDGAEGFTGNNINFMTISYPSLTATAVSMLFYDSIIYYNRSEEPIENTGFAYEKSIPAAFAADKMQTVGKYVHYLSVPCSFTQLSGNIFLYYDIKLPDSLTGSPLLISFYTSAGMAAKDVLLQNVKGSIPIDAELLNKDIFEVVFMIFTENRQTLSSTEILGLSISLFAHKSLLTYVPSILGNQSYYTAPYLSNIIIVQEGNTEIHNYPGYNNFILGKLSHTTLIQEEPLSTLNNISFELVDADKASLVFEQADNSEDLILRWTYTEEEAPETLRLLQKKLYAQLRYRRDNQSSDADAGSLTIKKYFSEISMASITLIIGGESYIFESLKNNSDFYLRKIIRFDNIDAEEEPVFDRYNYIVRRAGELSEPSPYGSDIVVGSTAPINLFTNSKSGQNTHLIGSSETNIFNIIYEGDVYISANGADNTINIEAVAGQKIIDITAKEGSRTKISIADGSADNCFISGKDIICTREIFPLGFFVNSIPDGNDESKLISAYQTGLDSNTDKNFLIKLIADGFSDSEAVIFSTLSVNEAGQKLGLEIRAAAESNGTAYRAVYSDETAKISELNYKVTTAHNQVTYIGFRAEGTDTELLIFDNEGSILGRSSQSAANELVTICHDQTAAVNYSRLDTPESASENSFIPDIIYQIGTAPSDEQYTQLIRLTEELTGDDEVLPDDDFMNTVTSLQALFADGGHYNTAFILNALSASSQLAERITVELNEGLLDLKSLIRYIRYKTAFNESFAAANKDFKEPERQKNLTNLINIGYSGVKELSDRWGNASLQTQEEE
jgi:hypothetical protein